MKKLARTLSVFTIAALLGLPALSAAEMQATTIRDRVIGDSLTAAYSEESGAEQSVMVFIGDIDHETAERGLSEATPAALTLTSVAEEYENQAEIEAVQADIMARRAASKEAYLKQNTAFANQYLDGKVEYISKYSPVIIASLDSVETNQLALNSAVESIELYEMEIAEEEPITAPLAVNDYSEEDVADYFNMIRADYMISTYNGSGIKIGIMEPGMPASEYHNQLGYNPDINNNNEYGNCYKPNEKAESFHCTLISLIINTVAPGADLYWGQMVSGNDSDGNPVVEYIEVVEWLLDKNVNVINFSRDLEGLGNYNSYDFNAKYLDYIVSYQNVTIIKTSGNVGLSGMSSGGMSYNSIVVGATDANGEWAEYILNPGSSSYNTMLTNRATKPDVSAPGSIISIDDMVDEGTSYAAPQVAALAARLMQVDADLMLYPDAVKAVIMTNVRSIYGENLTAPISATNSYTKMGAGVIDCSRAIHTTRGGGYIIDMFDPHTINTNNEIQVTLPANVTVRMTLVSLVNVSLDEAYLSTNKQVPRLLMNVYYGSQYITTSYVSSTYYYCNNAKIISFTTTAAGTYTIKIRNNSDSSEYIFYTIAWDY